MLDLNKLLSTWAIWMMLNTETINTKAAYFQMRCSLQIYEEPRWSYAFVEFTDKIDIGFSVCLPVIALTVLSVRALCKSLELEWTRNTVLRKQKKSVLFHFSSSLI